MLTVSPLQLQSLKTHGEQTYNQECCGLLIGHSAFEDGIWKRTVQTIKPTPNVWHQQTDIPNIERFSTTRRYSIAPEDVLRAQKVARIQGCDIIGVYHSHPDHAAVPSDCDRQWAWPQYSYIILSVQQGIARDIRSWVLDEQDQFQPETLVVDGIDASHSL